MASIRIFENLYGKALTNIKAYGTDEFDFTPNTLGRDFDVGEFGYVVWEFGENCLYISVGGLSAEIPPCQKVNELQVTDRICNHFIGAVLESIEFDGETYCIQFQGFDMLYGYFDPNEGYTDRDYFSLFFPFF